MWVFKATQGNQLICKDARVSGPELQVLVASGIKTAKLLIGLRKQFEAQMSLMGEITALRLPISYVYMKAYSKYGQTASKKTTIYKSDISDSDR